MTLTCGAEFDHENGIQVQSKKFFDFTKKGNAITAFMRPLEPQHLAMTNEEKAKYYGVFISVALFFLTNTI